VTEEKVLAVLAGIAIIVIGAVALTVITFEPRTRRDPVNKLYQRVCDELADVGLGREPWEGPLSYRDRVVAARPHLQAVMYELTELYLELLYRGKSPSADQLRLGIESFKVVLARLRSNLSGRARIAQP
jgi:hypothetical protein